jgi:hypothetical protein
MQSYYFIVECDDDVRKIKKLMKGKATITDTGLLLDGGVYMEEFECWCGHTIYKCVSEMKLEDIQKIWRDAMCDLHYAFQSLNTEDEFTGDRYCN